MTINRQQEEIMAVQDWELQQYHTAASAVVARLGDEPTEHIKSHDGCVKQRWIVQAVKMHELRLMLDAMRDYGPY
jgi:hypothetical protein